MITAAILLAAGPRDQSHEAPALLAWTDGDTLVEYQVAQLLAAGVDVIEVVLGADAERIIALVARNDVEPIIDPRWSEGMTASVRVGATAVPRDTNTAIIVEVEQPRPAAVYRRLLDEHRAHNAVITRPSFEGMPGTPIVVNRGVLAEARNLHDPLGLEAIAVRHAHEIHDVPFDSDIVLLEIRSVEDYERARHMFGFA
jgi:molybdenum cofactor cytidylyltransferase